MSGDIFHDTDAEAKANSIGYICMAIVLLGLVLGISTCVMRTEMQAAEHEFQLQKLECIKKKEAENK